jgi:hypothetical protein
MRAVEGACSGAAIPLTHFAQFSVIIAAHRKENGRSEIVLGFDGREPKVVLFALRMKGNRLIVLDRRR